MIYNAISEIGTNDKNVNCNALLLLEIQLWSVSFSDDLIESGEQWKWMVQGS